MRTRFVTAIAIAVLAASAAHSQPWLQPHIPTRAGNDNILDAKLHNPAYDLSDPQWAKHVCNDKVWLHGPGSPKFEWTPVLQPNQAAEENIVGLTGIVLEQHESPEDVWFTHPFASDQDVNKGGDWNLDVGWASNPEYDRLISPYLKKDDDIAARNALAAASGLREPHAIHVETDAQFVPPNYRAAIGDTVGIFGRWVVDCGHDSFQSEIHPPLLIVKASAPSSTETHVSLIGRPFLVSQTFDSKNRGFYDYLIAEVGKEAAKSFAPVPPPGILIAGDHLKADVGIEKLPFHGLQLMITFVRPPTKPLPNEILVVSYGFKVRSGVLVHLFNTNDSLGTVGISVLFNADAYKLPVLPTKQAWNIPLKAIGDHENLGPYLKSAQFGAFSLANPFMAGLLQKGVLASWYQLPALNDPSLVTVRASALPQNTVVEVDDNQVFPIAGFVNLKWVSFTLPSCIHRLPSRC